MVEACLLAAALRPAPEQVRRQVEDEGLDGALAWLREGSPGAFTELASSLGDETISAALARSELPPPWGDPPAMLRSRLMALEERARAALLRWRQLSTPLLVREETLLWPSAGHASLAPRVAPSHPAKEASPQGAEVTTRQGVEALQARARQRLARLLTTAPGPPYPPDPDDKPGEALTPGPPSAALRLAPRGGLFWCLPAAPSLASTAPALTLVAGRACVTLLASNLRSGESRVAVPPSTEGYRLALAGAPGSLPVPPLPGLDGARASAFRVKIDGTAERVLEPKIRPGQRWRLLVPPSLAGAALPGEAWTLGGGWRACEVALPARPAPAQVAQLAALGLAPPAASVGLAWYGAAPSCYRRHGEKQIAVFSARRPPLLRATRGGAVGRVTLLLTSENASASLDLEEDETLVALEDLDPGVFCLDLAPEDPHTEPAQLAFHLEQGGARGPAAAARARLGEIERSLHEDPEIRCALRGDERLSLELPPLWPVRVSVRPSTSSAPRRQNADAAGRLDLSGTLASLVRGLSRAPVADLVVDAGELGRLTLVHERPFDPEGTVAVLLALLQERLELLRRGSLELLQAAWIEPVCRGLGYELGAPRQAAPEDPWHRRMTILARRGRRLERQAYALLVASVEPPPSEALSRAWQQTPAPRALWTDGRRWRLLEQGRRHAGEPLDLDLSTTYAARTSLERLVARLGV